MSTIPPELTEAEWAIIKAVWDKQPCTAPDIQTSLSPSKGWTYSTVRTLMDRMVTKGLLTAKKARHITLYNAAIDRQQAQLSELRYALKHAFDGALKPMVETLLTSEKLSSSDLDELEAMIASRRRAHIASSQKGPKS